MPRCCQMGQNLCDWLGKSPSAWEEGERNFCGQFAANLLSSTNHIGRFVASQCGHPLYEMSKFSLDDQHGHSKSKMRPIFRI